MVISNLVNNYSALVKVASGSAIRFSNLHKKNIPKNYPEIEIEISRQKHFTTIGGKLRFQAQDSFFGIFFFLFFLRFRDLKN